MLTTRLPRAASKAILPMRPKPAASVVTSPVLRERRRMLCCELSPMNRELPSASSATSEGYTNAAAVPNPSAVPADDPPASVVTVREDTLMRRIRKLSRSPK
jgi:hypothetical protein